MVRVSLQNRKLWRWQRRHANAKTKAKTNTQASAKTKAKSGMKKPSALCDMTLPDLFRAQKEAEVARRKPKRISKGELSATVTSSYSAQSFLDAVRVGAAGLNLRSRGLRKQHRSRGLRKQHRSHGLRKHAVVP